MSRLLAMPIALLCYFAFFGSFAYLVAFTAGIDLLPTHVDKGLAAPPLTAALIDLALIALFGIQHSVMARPAFKAGWTKIVPPALERSVFCLATAICLVILFAFWHPIEGTVWSVGIEAARIAIWALFLLGWTILFVSTWLLNHFELFGLSQAWHHSRATEPPPPEFRTPLFCKLVRHPLYTGFLIAFWSTPDMTMSHLLLAAGMSIYIFVGIAYEERDLVTHFGATYTEYRSRVGSVIPGIGRRAG